MCASAAISASACSISTSCTAAAIYVLELSSYQLDLAETLKCDVAVMLNLSPDHLARHGGMDGYVQAKRRIFRNQGPADWAIIGVDDTRSQVMCTQLSAEGLRKVMPVSAEYGLGRGVSVLDGQLCDSMTGRAGAPHDISKARALPGRHNHQNAAAAYAACRALGLEPNDILAAIEIFPGLPHRLETIGVIDGVRFINDRRPPTPRRPSRRCAPSRMRGGSSAAGRRRRGSTISRPFFAPIRKAYLIGESTEAFARVLAGKLEAEKSRTLDAAVAGGVRRRARFGQAAAGRAVLAGVRQLRPVPRLRAARRGLPPGRRQARQATLTDRTGVTPCRSFAGRTLRPSPNGGARSTRA